MADDDKYSIKTDYRSAEIAQFLNKRGASGICEVCANNKWTLQTESNGQSVSLLMLDREPPSFIRPKSFIFFMAMCENCGNTKLFNRDLVLKFMNEEGSE